MKKRAPLILIVLLFIAGLAIMLYPTVSDWNNNRHQSHVIEDHEKALQSIESDQLAAEKKAAEEFNEKLLDNVILTDPFDEAAFKNISEGYEEVLNIGGDGIMGYIRIPKIGVKLAIYHGTKSEVISKGVGHLENTSLPIGGISSHSVLSSHTGLPTAKLFTDLDKMELGDKFYLEVLGETLAYEVDQIKTVLPSDTGDLFVDKTKDYMTLVTCTPYGVNSHRLLVRGTRVPYEESDDTKDTSPVKSTINYPYVIAGVLLLVILLAYIIVSRVSRKKRARREG